MARRQSYAARVLHPPSPETHDQPRIAQRVITCRRPLRRRVTIAATRYSRERFSGTAGSYRLVKVVSRSPRPLQKVRMYDQNAAGDNPPQPLLALPLTFTAFMPWRLVPRQEAGKRWSLRRQVKRGCK